MPWRPGAQDRRQRKRRLAWPGFTVRARLPARPSAPLKYGTLLPLFHATAPRPWPTLTFMRWPMEATANPEVGMGTQRLAFWFRQLGWRAEPSRREPDPIEMGTAFGLDASLAPESDWADSVIAGAPDTRQAINSRY